MFLPKQEIFEKLSELGYDCYQGSQVVFSKTPAITFRIDDNSVNLDLDNEISNQEIIATIDIFTDKGSQGSKILAEVEEKMRSIGYRLANSIDVPQPKGALYHINCRFIAKKG